MKIKKIVYLLIIFPLLAGGAKEMSGTELPSPFCIIPQPRNVVLLGGQGIKPESLEKVLLDGRFERPVMGVNLGRLVNSLKPGNGTLVLKLDTSLCIPGSGEGYVLTISKNAVEIVSRGEAGLFYGCQTLEQLMEDAVENNIALPACKITDFPSMSYRAVHFDVKHHLDHMNYYYGSIDRLARYKINAVVFEFEDKLRYQRQPLVGAPQSISIDEMASLTKYARERHIEITPLVQGLGHATFILKHQSYAYLRELSWNKWAFCPLNEGTYQVLFDLYRDAIEATPGSKYLHIGGDEIGNIGLCPRCKPMADKEGMMALNLYWLKRVCEFAEQNGRIPIFWDDMPFNHAGLYESLERDDHDSIKLEKEWNLGIPKLDKLLSDFPQNCVYMRWNYTMARQPGNIKALDWYRGRGLKVMVATAANSGGGTLFPADDRDKGMSSIGIAAIQSFIQLADEKGIDGVLATAWDDASPHMETYWRGFIASAEYSWSPQSRTLSEFDDAFLQREFEIKFSNYADFYAQLREATRFWYGAYFKKGGRISFGNELDDIPQVAHWIPPTQYPEKVNPYDRLIDLPDLKAPGIWSKTYTDRLNKAALETAKYENTSKILKQLLNSSSKNRYHWELFIAMNDFQITAPHLLLALKECDSDNNESQKKGIQAVHKALNEFKMVWENLRTVYSQTRFLANPANFVSDPYFHFASRKSDLSWMIQAEEIYHEMIIKWMKEFGNN
jgi:hypothetical protein